MILRRRLWSLWVIFLVVYAVAVWAGGGRIGFGPVTRITGIVIALLAAGALVTLTEASFIRPLLRRLRRLDDYIRSVDSTPPPPRIRGIDEIESIRDDLRRVLRRFDETRGIQVARRLRAEVDSRIDALTRLYNHRTFARFLVEEWERAQRLWAPLALLILDVDRFKAFNDDLGHLAGNQVLEKVAGAVRDGVRDSDLVFRYAGDEFAVLLPRTGLQQAVAVAEKIRQRVNGQRIEGGGGRPLSVSIGAAETGVEMRSPEDLVEAADRALYQAKEGGRNVVAYPVGRSEYKLYGRE